MKRRDLIALSGALSVLAAARAFAQAPKAPRRMAWLIPGSVENFRPVVEAFAARMKELGYVEGRDYVVEKRMSEGRLEVLTPLARELGVELRHVERTSRRSSRRTSRRTSRRNTATDAPCRTGLYCEIKARRLARVCRPSEYRTQ